MKFLRNNKGVIMFYLLIAVTTLIVVNSNKVDLEDHSLTYNEGISFLSN